MRIKNVRENLLISYYLGKMSCLAQLCANGTCVHTFTQFLFRKLWLLLPICYSKRREVI